MKTLPVTITKNSKNRQATFMVEFDAERFERIAAALGMFSEEFLVSLDRAEKDVKAGRVHVAKSLAELM